MRSDGAETMTVMRAPTARRSRAPRIGLVLGGGGIAGYAFHAGALGALQEATGWDPRTAEIIVGTSAGSGMAALLRGNVAVPDLVENILSAPTDPIAMARLREVSGRGQNLIGQFWLGPASPSLAVRELFRFHRIRPLNVLSACLPIGRVGNDAVREQAAMLHADEWPDADTWIPAVNLSTGEVTVFGRDSHAPVALADAVAASCAIPGFFKPVRINGQRYVDGGVRSMVNADLLAGLDLDLVVVLSPMSADALSVRRPVAAAIRSFPRFQLRRELRHVEEQGTATLGLEPDSSVTRAMGANPMDPTSVVPVLTATSVAISVELARAEHTDLLTLLRDAGTLLPSPADVPYPE